MCGARRRAHAITHSDRVVSGTLGGLLGGFGPEFAEVGAEHEALVVEIDDERCTWRGARPPRRGVGIPHNTTQPAVVAHLAISRGREGHAGGRRRGRGGLVV